MTDANVPAVKTNRILVALDTSARGQAALKAALQLALMTSAEVEGLFVEDEDLVRLASLPFACEVDLISASPRELQTVNMERALRTAAEDAQRVFTNALQQLNLQWTFRIVRGTLTNASLAAAVGVDLLVIGQQGRSPHVMAAAFLPKRASDNRVVAVFDGTPAAFRTLELASSLSDPNMHPLSILVLASNGAEVTQQVFSWLEQQNVRAEVGQVLNPSEEAIIDFVRRWKPGVLLINRNSEFLNDSEIRRLVNEFECPLILC